MNLRRGFARLGRVLTYIYWVPILILVPLAAYGNAKSEAAWHERPIDWLDLGNTVSVQLGAALFIYSILWLLALGAAWVIEGFFGPKDA